ncbi:HlyD family secretion protein [Desulfurispora thermophila]|uniref:HlyD family secretion protein n=1 Tax=Desulfurispora thermophila TaxID=265470 RepID=UPI000379A5AD|nr:HlyD family efflux transporter periplasmic adaptor subunit [Desulfurispora thermophila]
MRTSPKFYRSSVAFLTSALLLFSATISLTGCSRAASAGRELSGTVEATEYNVSSKIPGRLLEVKVREGDTVQAGQVVAVLDSKELQAKEQELLAQISAAQAGLAQAGTSVALQDKSTAAALEQARATLERARADLDVTEKTRQRMEALYAEGAISAQQLDEVRARAQAARAAVDQAQAAVNQALSARLQVQLGQDNVAAAQAKLAQARAALEQVRANLSETTIKAPAAGTVTEVNVEKGELVSTGLPIMVISDFQHNHVNVKVPQDIVQSLQTGQRARLTLGNTTYQGQIVDISRKPNFATHRATNDRGEKDIVTYNVKIQVDDPRLRPGMELTVHFQ